MTQTGRPKSGTFYAGFDTSNQTAGYMESAKQSREAADWLLTEAHTMNAARSTRFREEVRAFYMRTGSKARRAVLNAISNRDFKKALQGMSMWADWRDNFLKS
jgi:hypothetical protein